MKVTHVTTRVLRTPADNPLVVGLPEPTDTREFVTLELGTDQGLVGLGLTFFGGALTPALKAAVDAFANLIVGDDPTQTEAVVAASSPLLSPRWTSRAGISRARRRANPCARSWETCATACRPMRAAPSCASTPWTISPRRDRDW